MISKQISFLIRFYLCWLKLGSWQFSATAAHFSIWLEHLNSAAPECFISCFSWTVWINHLKYATKLSLIIDDFIHLLCINSLLDSVCNCQREEVAFKCCSFSLYFWQAKYFISERWNHLRKTKLHLPCPPSQEKTKSIITAAFSVKLGWKLCRNRSLACNVKCTSQINWE